VSGLTVFFIRAVLSAAFAVVLGRAFFSSASPAAIPAFGIFLLAAAYLADYLRKRKGE